MKAHHYIFAVLTLASLTLSGCVGVDFTDDFDKLKEAASESGGSSGSCPVGTWKSPTCNSGSGKYLVYYFGSNGDGYASNPECTNLCTGPIKFYFHYTKTSNTISYTFYKADPVTCSGTTSTPNVPTGNYTITYTCGNNGDQLTTETSNTQTGARSTTVFTRM